MGIESCMEKQCNMTSAISSNGTSYGRSKFSQKLRISFGDALVTFYLLKQSSCKEESKFLLIVPFVTKRWSPDHIYFWIQCWCDLQKANTSSISLQIVQRTQGMDASWVYCEVDASVIENSASLGAVIRTHTGLFLAAISDLLDRSMKPV
nr:hypothetical protein Iba_chr06aCG11630 [Ipomoea batatas]